MFLNDSELQNYSFYKYKHVSGTKKFNFSRSQGRQRGVKATALRTFTCSQDFTNY